MPTYAQLCPVKPTCAHLSRCFLVHRPDPRADDATLRPAVVLRTHGRELRVCRGLVLPKRLCCDSWRPTRSYFDELAFPKQFTDMIRRQIEISRAGGQVHTRLASDELFAIDRYRITAALS